jgi:hypothetical protein
MRLLESFCTVALLSLVVGAELTSLGEADPFIMILDDTPPAISVASPLSNQEFSSNDVLLSFTLTKPVSWNNKTGTGFTTGKLHSVSYYVDGISYEEIIVDSDLTDPFSYSKVLTNLPSGEHSLLIVEEGEAYWKEWHLEGKITTPLTGSTEVIFIVDTGEPFISNLSVQNKTYKNPDIPLNFSVSIPVSWMGYSLNDQDNITITGNTTLTGLPDGAHNIVVYAMNNSGYSFSSRKVSFTVDMPPIISILSPMNETYYTHNISLVFTITESARSIVFSLDGTENAISGNTTMNGVSTGSHILLIYVNDTAGNAGTSQAVNFSIAPEPTPTIDQNPTETPSPSSESTPITEPSTNVEMPSTSNQYLIEWVVAGLVSTVAISAGLLIYFKKRSRRP